MTNLIRICIRDVTQYEHVIWIEQIMCTKQMQIQKMIGIFFFKLRFMEHLVKTRGVLQD